MNKVHGFEGKVTWHERNSTSLLSPIGLI
jgi:hypothetical protein